MTLPVVWGSALELQDVRGKPALVYLERPRSVGELLEGAGRWGDREYLVDDRRRISFAELLTHVDAVAAHLAGIGIEPGDRVMILARNSVEWVVTYWAIARAGAVAVLGNAWWAAPEAQRAVAFVGARLVFADAERAALLEESTPVLRVEAVADLLVGARDDAPSSSESDLPEVDEDEAAVIMFTSGTTGRPKGAVFSHRSIIANQHGFLARTKRLPSDLADDHRATTSLLSTPLFHVGGLQALVTAFVTGSRLVFTSGRFDPAQVVDLIERERITVWGAVPTMVQRVVEYAATAGRDLSSVRAIGMGGAPLPPHVIAQVPEVFPSARRGTSTNYGATEAGGIICTDSGDAILDRPGTSGRPLPHVELRLGDADEILVRSAALMTEYWRESESPIDAEGWLHTGDVGRIDADGFLFVVDRIKDLIIRGGENIAAAHVEHALATHPAVEAAAVIGLPHPDLGEEVGAVVLLRPDAKATSEEFADYLADRVARFEVPSQWWFRTEEFPTNATGKVDKRALRKEFPAVRATGAGADGSPARR